MTFKNLFKLKLILCLLVVVFVTNFVFAVSDLNFIRKEIYGLTTTALSGNSGNYLSEKLKNTARYYFKLNKDEEILYAYSTAFWDDSSRISQGCVITNFSITVVWDNDRPNEYWKFFWDDIENCEYKDMSLYFKAIGYKNGERAKFIQSWKLDLSYITKTKSNMYSEGNRIAQTFTEIAQYLKQKDKEETEDLYQYERNLLNKITDLGNRKEWKEATKIFNEEIDKNSWLYNWTKAYMLAVKDNLYEQALKELDNIKSFYLKYEQYQTRVLQASIYYVLERYNLARKTLLSLVNENVNTAKELVNDTYFDKIFVEYNENFYKIPYNERKIIMPVEESDLMDTNSFTMLDIKNLPKNIIFPQGHPKECELYVGHPYLPNKYLPIENHELELTEDKIREFCDFVEELGATEVYVETVSYIDESGITHTEKVRDGNLNIVGYGSADGEYKTSDSKEFGNKLRKIIKIHEKFIPKKAPKLAENLYWYYQEPSWKRLYDKRMRGALIERSETISTAKSSMVQENEETDINADINILVAKVGGKYSKLENKKYYKNKDIEIDLHVVFEPLENLKQFEEQK
jgi:hypothetical protein